MKKAQKARCPILAGIALALSALSANAQIDSNRPVTLAIKSQPLRDALNEWAQQTGFQLISPSSEILSRVVVPAVTGSLSPRAALEQLLAGTSFTYELLDGRTVVIRGRSKQESLASGWRKIANETTAHHLAYASDAPKGDTRLAQADAAGAASGSSSSASRDAAARAIMEEIVVTAQKREQRLQDVPISISVLNGTDLDQSTAEGVSETLNRVPGVATTVGHLGNGTGVAVRGVTAGALLFSGSSPIAYYLDSVPFGMVKTAIAPDANAYDMERIEVLRGPQGTLYGASAQNGVVRVLTRDANLDALEFKMRAAGSSTEGGGANYRGDAAINVPIVEGKLAVRAVVGYEDLSGWIDKPIRRDANDAELTNARLKINAQPTAALSIGLSAWISRSDYGAPALAADNARRSSLVDEPIETDYDVYGLKFGYDFGPITITSMSSYLDYSNESYLDWAPFVPGTRLFTRNSSQVFSQEVILNSSTGGPWRWSVGAMYRDAEDGLYQFRQGYVVPTDFSDISKSIAVFGELTRLFLDGQIELTGGLRYFEDDVTQKENVRHTGNFSEPLYRAKEKFDEVSPRVVLVWHPSSNLSIYGSYSEGFRSGFNQNANVIRAAPQFPPLEADTLRNYEIGAKGTFFGGRLAFDTAVFYIDWQEVQQALTVNVGGTVNVAALVNGKSASGMGAEFALFATPVDGFQLGINASWNDLTMDSDVYSAVAAAASFENVLLFAKGARLNLSPEYTVGASAEYEFALGRSGFRARLSASANYISEQDTRTIFGNVLRIGEGDSMLISRAGFSIESPGRWTGTIFVDNANNEDGAPSRQPFGIDDWATRVRPRTVGAQLEYRF